MNLNTSQALKNKDQPKNQRSEKIVNFLIKKEEKKKIVLRF